MNVKDLGTTPILAAVVWYYVDPRTAKVHRWDGTDGPNATLAYTFYGPIVPPTIVSWLWDFGDGNTSTAQNPTHVYATPGTYTVSLTVTTSNGASDTETKIAYITVLAAVNVTIPVDDTGGLGLDGATDGLVTTQRNVLIPSPGHVITCGPGVIAGAHLVGELVGGDSYQDFPLALDGGSGTVTTEANTTITVEETGTLALAGGEVTVSPVLNPIGCVEIDLLSSLCDDLDMLTAACAELAPAASSRDDLELALAGVEETDLEPLVCLEA